MVAPGSRRFVYFIFFGYPGFGAEIANEIFEGARFEGVQFWSVALGHVAPLDVGPHPLAQPQVGDEPQKYRVGGRFPGRLPVGYRPSG